MNSRQKQFAIFYASGMTQEQAYISAGYSPIEARSNAATLFSTNQSVRDCFNQLIKRKEDMSLAKMVETIMSPKERQVRLSEIARARLVEFQGADGTPALTKDTPNNAAAKEFYHKKRIDREGNPVVTKLIKLTDPIAAIQELNKMDGSYAPSKHMVAQRVQINVEMVEKGKQGTDDLT